MPSQALWQIKPHTRTKHLILKVYLQAWLPIMATQHGRILLIDGFAGRGRYSGGEEGSPLVILRTLIEHPRFKNTSGGREVLVLFIERRAGNANALRNELAQFERAQRIPKWIMYEMKEGGFTELVNSLIDSLEVSKVTLPPTFAFIDPYGYRVPLKTISRLLQFDRCECVVNFMYKFINRATHRTEPQILTYLDDLFGTPDWRQVRTLLAPEDRQLFLVNLYKNQLQQQASLPYVRTFQMIDSGNRTEYFLFFGTRSPRGLSEMKKAMWKADPEGGQVFSDRTEPNSGQLILIERMANVGPLKGLLQDQFRGRGWTDIADIEKYVLFETPYSEQLHLKTSSLKPMELDRVLEVERPRGSRDRPGTYPNGTKVRFI